MWSQSCLDYATENMPIQRASSESGIDSLNLYIAFIIWIQYLWKIIIYTLI